MGANDQKRRSLLFPFRAPAKAEPAKFEVVNRKKSPLSQGQTKPVTPLTTAQKPPTTTSALKEPSTRPPQQATSTARLDPSPSPNLKKPLITTTGPELKTQPSLDPGHPKSSHRLISPPRIHVPLHSHKADTRPDTFDPQTQPNLNIIGNVPPVPDYNSHYYPPPVTIQGRNVSLTKKAVPPRKRPPTFGALGEQVTSSTESLHGQVDNKRLSGSPCPLSSKLLNNESQESANALKDADVGPANDSVASNDTPLGQIRPQDANDNQLEIKSEQMVQEVNVQLEPVYSFEAPQLSRGPEFPQSESPESFQASVSLLSESNFETPQGQETENDTESESQQAIIVQCDEGSIQESPIDSTNVPGAFSPTESSNNRPQVKSMLLDDEETPKEQKTDSESAPLPRTAEPPLSESFNELERPSLPPHRDSSPVSVASHEFFDASENIQKDATPEPFFPPTTTPSEPIEPTPTKNIDSDAESIEVKPLKFHKKTLSTASTASDARLYVSPSEKGHKKQLSLSDEILRDIERFQPFGAHLTDEIDEVSPVSPLKTKKLNESSIQERSFEDGYNYEEPKRLAITNLSDQDIMDTLDEDRDDRNQLFHDSSDDEMKAVKSSPGLQESYGTGFPYGDLSDSNFDVDSSSVRPEIDYEPSPSPSPFQSSVSQRRAPFGDEEEDNAIFNQEISHGEAYPFETQEEPVRTVPRSDSKFNLNQELSRSEENSFVATPYESSNGGIDDRSSYAVTTGYKDDESQYSYDPSISNNRQLHVTNNDQSSEKTSDDDTAGSYSYAPEPRTFHVVNDGNYSSSDEDENSFGPDTEEKYFGNDYSVIHQEDLQRLAPVDTAFDEDEDGEILSFTSKSPVGLELPMNHSPVKRHYHSAQNPSDMELSSRDQDSLSSFAQSEQVPHLQPSIIGHKNINYDRRDEIAAPVAYIPSAKLPSRRPPPSDAPAATRVARSVSVTSPIPPMYNSIKEDPSPVSPNIPHSEIHIPEKSAYVEQLRNSSATSNSTSPASKWGLPIGISEIDHSKLRIMLSKVSYKKGAVRHKVDLKHGKIKPRLLASEVDDEDDIVPSSNNSILERQSNELERYKTESGSSFKLEASPTQSFSSLPNPTSSPRTETSSSINRSGTLFQDKVSNQILLGRSGTVMDGGKSKQGMTLFIANPDLDSD